MIFLKHRPPVWLSSHMIWELLLKTFIPVSRIFDNEGDILIFSRNVRKSNASENYFKKNKIKNIMKY